MNSTIGLAKVILFYSGYSESCKKLFEYLQSYNFTSIDYICVDSSEIRDKISEHVDNVPNLLLLYRDGKGENYEGSKVFQWFSNIVSEHDSQQTPDSHPQRQKEPFGYHTPTPIPSNKPKPYRRIDLPMKHPPSNTRIFGDNVEDSDDDYGFDGDDGSGYGRINTPAMPQEQTVDDPGMNIGRRMVDSYRRNESDDEDYDSEDDDEDYGYDGGGGGRAMPGENRSRERNPIMDVAAKMAEQRGNTDDIDRPTLKPTLPPDRPRRRHGRRR
jgi:hypothetical protein